MLNLELELHWRDIVDLLSRHNSLRQTFQADRLRIVCVDVNVLGHGGVFPHGNGQSSSSANPILPLLNVTEKTSWIQILPMLQKIEKEPMAEKLLNDVPTLRKLQEMHGPSGAVRDAMMKLGSKWDVQQKIQQKKRPAAEVARESWMNACAKKQENC